MSQNIFPHRDGDRVLGVFDFITSTETVGGLHRYPANDIIFKNLENFNHDLFVVDVRGTNKQCIILTGKLVRKMGIYDDSVDCGDGSEN
jgi:hypothetical protein